MRLLEWYARFLDWTGDPVSAYLATWCLVLYVIGWCLGAYQ
jgi:hypothetical protein